MYFFFGKWWNYDVIIYIIDLIHVYNENAFGF